MRNRRGGFIFGTVRSSGDVAIAARLALLSVLILVALIGCAGSQRVGAAARDVDGIADSTVEEIASGFDGVESFGDTDSIRIAREQAIERAERFGMAQDHFILARDYERRGMREMAAQLYETAYDFWPKPGFLRRMLLNTYMSTGEFEKAHGLFFRDGETLEDLSPEDRRLLGLIYSNLGSVNKFAKAIESLGAQMTNEEIFSIVMLYRAAGKDDMAIESLRKFFAAGGAPDIGIRIIQMNVGERKIAEADSVARILYDAYPKNAEVIAIYGAVKNMVRDTSEAARLFNEALAIDSTNEEALRSLAHINISAQRYAEAVGYYRRLVAQGRAGQYRRGLAFLLFHLKEYEEAGALLDTILKEGGNLEPQELHSYRGLIYIQTEEYGKAAEQFKAAIALDSANVGHWHELCYAYIFAKDTVNAHASVNQYLAKFPNSGVGWRLRGYVYDFEKKHKEAAEQFRKAVAIDSTDYVSWFYLGASLERQKLIDEAADAFRTVLRHNPYDDAAANYLGYMWADAGINLDSAKTLIEVALKIDSLNGAYLDSYAWVFYRMEDYKQALYYMNKALEQDDVKNDPIAYEHLGDIQFKLEDYRAAETAYKRALELKTKDAVRINARLAEIRRILRSR